MEYIVKALDAAGYPASWLVAIESTLTRVRAALAKADGGVA
jgi:hypothetical protein